MVRSRFLFAVMALMVATQPAWAQGRALGRAGGGPPGQVGGGPPGQVGAAAASAAANAASAAAANAASAAAASAASVAAASSGPPGQAAGGPPGLAGGGPPGQVDGASSAVGAVSAAAVGGASSAAVGNARSAAVSNGNPSNAASAAASNAGASNASNGRSATAGDPGNNSPATAGQGDGAGVSNGNANAANGSNGRSATAGDPGNNRPADVGQNGSANGSNGNGNANGNANGNGNGNSSDTSNGRSATAGDPGNNRPADAGQGRSADVSNGNGASGNKGNTSSADLAEGDSAAAGGNAITASADEAEQGASRDPVGRPNDPRTVALVLARDDRGAAIVRGEILAVSPSDASLAIAQGLNFHVLRQDRLQALGISSVTLAIPDGMTASGALARLRQADPGGNYDYAHVYNPSGGASASTARSAKPTFSKPEPSIRLGMIDGGIEKKHSAVKGATITVQRFAGTERAAGTAHGTAIASLLVGQDSGFSGYLPGAQLYAADIFGGAPDGGSADTIARALNWLAANNIAVTNVSLAGPPNALLEAAVRGFVARGHVLVAAVGNDGPAAPPNYPAAYPGVVAVTSVDASRHLQLDANRGIAQFAALGVDVRAASLPLGYSNVAGTSYATPAVAARFALILPTADPKIATEVRDRLSQGAVMIDGYGDIPTTPLSHSSMSGSAAAR